MGGEGGLASAGLSSLPHYVVACGGLTAAGSVAAWPSIVHVWCAPPLPPVRPGRGCSAAACGKPSRGGPVHGSGGVRALSLAPAAAVGLAAEVELVRACACPGWACACGPVHVSGCCSNHIENWM